MYSTILNSTLLALLQVLVFVLNGCRWHEHEYLTVIGQRKYSTVQLPVNTLLGPFSFTVRSARTRTCTICAPICSLRPINLMRPESYSLPGTVH